ncbi:phosphoribosylpyrophosphate synthetase [Flavobacterium tyrosinilyticum]|uniref:phosphoribosylpyrophosphate synthetase n=1 Tax=Flavobacterium TaxID=237 RepID=UPI00202EF92D|nr:phosphoribosylpyrophosphate synthetase [Flavobacterium tyrosinilyticum]MCM0667638.1 phosphoribosylpyrophosphate synthetase [Flavobacterium tyrosinilyticum]
MTNYDTLTEAINTKQAEGYTFDFNLSNSTLNCKTLNQTFEANEFHVDAFYRFEGDSNPDDSSILYAIRTQSGVKGLLVDAYGAYSDNLNAAMIQKLQMR